RIPILVRQRRSRPVASRRIGIQIAADEAQFMNAPFEFCNRIFRGYTGRLRQLANAYKILRVEGTHSIDQIIAVLGPVAADRFIADVMAHGRSTRRKNRDVGAALPLKFQLSAFEAFSNLIVADIQRALYRNIRWIFESSDLFVSVILKWLWCGRIMAVAIDDHR